MRKSELEKFKKKLLELKSEIFSGIQSLQSMNLGKNQSGDLSVVPKHMADVGTDNYDREFYLNLAEEEREHFFMIEKALERIETKGYGICEECDKKINEKRLEAVPYATMCIPCQEKQEQEVMRPR